MASKTKAKEDKPDALQPVITVGLAWLVPGLGHFFLGRKLRGVIIFMVITALFWTGIGIGGVLTVDRAKERWWFLAEMGTGIQGLYAWQRSNAVYARIREDKSIYKVPPGYSGPSATYVTPAVEKALVREGVDLVHPTENVARAYAGVAGLMNMLCVFDALMLCLLGRRGEPKRPEKDEEAGEEDNT
ncbi:MAG: DUF6677 family protein [Phycisphaerae bacterium]